MFNRVVGCGVLLCFYGGLLHYQAFRYRAYKKLIFLMFCTMQLMISDALAWFFKGCNSPEGFYIVRAANYFAFFFGFLVIPIGAEYLSYLVCKHSGLKKLYWHQIEWGISSLGIILVTINLFFPFLYSFDENNTYYRLEAAYLPAVIASIGLIVSFIANIRYFKYMNYSEKAVYLISIILALIAAVIQIMFYGVSFIFLSIVISVMLYFLSFIHNYMEYNVEKEKQIAEEKLRLINRQIQPHFIFNSLSLIRHLCMKAPDEAIETINEFSGYLRSTTDFLNEPKCIPVTKELDLVKHYLYMEKKRFGKSISVEYDIQDTDFEIPPFSVQISVENAIKHGLRASKVENGLIRISSKSEGTNHTIIIEDNGTGFDPDTPLPNDQTTSHTGITNASKRLEAMCGGTLSIRSKPGKGTTVIISVPQKKG